MADINKVDIDWIYSLKKKILLTIIAVLTVTILMTLFFISVKMRDTMVNDSKAKTQELALTVNSNLRQLMLLNAPNSIQGTVEDLASKNDSIERVFILNNEGEIAYSSVPAEVGQSISQDSASCIVCHSQAASTRSSDVLLETESDIHRNVTLIYNDKSCHDCHDQGEEINGKLIIDRSLQETFSLISAIQLIIICSGLVGLVIMIPLFSRVLSKGINKYIFEIFTRNEELRLLYVMVERLSKTLDMEQLKSIVVEIFKDVLDAEEVEIVLPRGEGGCSAYHWQSSTGKMDRKKVVPGEADSLLIDSWLAGEMDDGEMKVAKGELCIPIKKGRHRLALIITRKNNGGFDDARLQLCSVISSHIGVAFDNARLYQIAITDELTNTFTKRYFRRCIDDTYDEFKKYGSKFSLIMMDLDKFKQVNDTHGHVVGDSVLKLLGEIIKTTVRDNDQVFRYGGEEFAVLLPGTDSKGAQFVAERIRLATEEAVFEPGTIDMKLTLSLGVATCPGPPTVRDMIVAADEALYDAKKGGRNQVVVSQKEFKIEPEEPWAP